MPRSRPPPGSVASTGVACAREEVERLCDDVIMLRADKVVDRGSPEWLLQRYGRDTLEDVFIDVARDTGRVGNGGVG